MANTVKPRFKNNANDPRNDMRIPTTKHIKNPLILVDQLKVALSLS